MRTTFGCCGLSIFRFNYNHRKSLPISVDAYSGYNANEPPRYCELDDEVYEIANIENQRQSPEATFFKASGTEGKTYILRYDEHQDEWTLQSGFDGDELLANRALN